jgi:glycosyltransferase involved in cell wall biosynthesis
MADQNCDQNVPGPQQVRKTRHNSSRREQLKSFPSTHSGNPRGASRQPEHLQRREDPPGNAPEQRRVARNRYGHGDVMSTDTRSAAYQRGATPMGVTAQPTIRIAQVAPLCESVPPQLYGGTERVVSFLTDELVRRGHDVTLFASGDSHTAAKLVPAWPRALRLGERCRDDVAPHLLMMEQVAQRAEDFDIIHFHIGQLHFPLVRRLSVAHVTTMHGRLDLPELRPLYREFNDIPVVSISQAQREPLPEAKWTGTVYHGLPPDRLSFHPEPGRYLAFLGRVSPEKRVDRAIRIAVACGLPLRIAAKVDPIDRGYFEREIRPLLDNPLIEFIGEIGEAQKSEFLGQAKALLFPIDWPEPFGLVMIEALACGTPVIAFDGGSVPEVIDDGVTGFIVDTIDQAVDATRKVELLDRRACRAVFERRFSVTRMAADYLQLYQTLVARTSSLAAVAGGL